MAGEVKKINGIEYVDELDDTTIDAVIRGLKDKTKDPDEDEIMKELKSKIPSQEPE